MATSAASTQSRSAQPWLVVALAVFAIAWGGNQFTPLMVLYRQEGELDLVFVDLLLFVYAVGIVPALLLSGPLSDGIGRKPVMLAGPLFSVLGSVLIAVGETTAPVLAVGRLLSGIAVGIGMAVGGSWVKELSTPRFDAAAKSTSGAKRQSMALTAGFGVGAFIAAILAQFAPLPGQLAYILHIVVTIPTVLLLLAVPETRQSPTTGGVPSLVQALRTPSVKHPRFLLIPALTAPWVFGCAAVAYAIIPSLVQQEVSQPIFISGVLTGVALICGFTIQQFGPRISSDTSARGSVVALVLVFIGMGMAALMSRDPHLATAIPCSMVLGMGYGLVMYTGLNEVQRIAGPRDLAGLSGIFYGLSYIGFAFPAMLTELAKHWEWMTYPVMLTFGMVVAVGMLVIVSKYSRAYLPQGGTD
ncbi:MFS transporter [Corynebacterium sp. TAE3-ERU12]|uniref:MFS transporter n=1 Tax=Corynebacterium sp. TAE3-ERU12 TaxID=2849491 RepID=UPI002106B300|nr:MFS transporter [Corynebacterium sp. TAE3-ERU12]